ncbi:phage tail protein [Clostridium senegalense]|uniref:phage tail protein n=1 Tax=Clostridium senegalense TaxID=1465809 RepID=UPI000288F314|nr:phage tail protein [Clostridium senegalense]
MSEQFYTILTKVGKAKIANATALGTKVNFCKFQVGDSNGAYYNPTEEQTELKHKVWEGNINNIRVDDKNPNWIIIEVILPSEIGGFTIREAAILDDEDNVIAVAKYPETYKPQTKDGSSKDILIRTILEVSNANSVTLKVDPTVILATKKDIEVLEQKIKNIKVPVTSVNTKTGDIVLKAEDINCNNGKSVESHLDEITKKQEEVFQSVSSGKIKVAGAITDKGISTLANDTFDVMATNIRKIKTGYNSGDNIPLDKLNIEYTRDSDPLLIKQKGIGSSIRNLTEVQISQDRQYAYFRYYDTWGYCNLLIYDIKENSVVYSITKDDGMYFTVVDTFILIAYYDRKSKTPYIEKRSLSGSSIWNKKLEYPSEKMFVDYYNDKIYSPRCLSGGQVQYIDVLNPSGALISTIEVINAKPSLSSSGICAVYNNKLYYNRFTEIYNLNNDNIIKEPNELLDYGLDIIREIEQGKYLCKKFDKKLYEYNLKNNTLVKSYDMGDYSYKHADIDKKNEYIYFLPTNNNGYTSAIAKYSIKTNSLIYRKSLIGSESESCAIVVENEGDIYKFTHYTSDPVIMQYAEERKILSSISVKQLLI